jgi:SAM-dependent methyltransferase
MTFALRNQLESRATVLERRSSPKIRWWYPDYLAVQSLTRDLAQGFPLLTGKLLDLGCGNRPYQSLLNNITSYVPYDADVHGGEPAVVGLADRLPFPAGTFDSVLCTQVLEHVERPWQVIAEIARVLGPNGKLLLSAPQAWRLHEEPFDFYRFTRYGLSYLMRNCGLDVISIAPQGGVWILVGTSINNSLYNKTAKKSRFIRMLRAGCIAIINLLFGLVDGFWHDDGDTYNYVVIARR